MFQKYETIVQKLQTATLDARKYEAVYNAIGGSLRPLPDDAELVVVIPLNSTESVRWGYKIPQPERYVIRTLAKDESAARELHEDIETALPLPHYRSQTIRTLPKSNAFFIYEREFEVSPNAT
jgi:hypothetical protein